MPFQHCMAEQRNHFHEDRAIPLRYVRKVLQLNDPMDINKDTSLDSIFKYYKARGVDYKTEWAQFYEDALASTMRMQNWNPRDFQYVVADGKAHKFTVDAGKVVLGPVDVHADPSHIQAKDKNLLQNYGRPYSNIGKPSGTYIQKPLQPKFGEGGLLKWSPVVHVV